MSKALPASCTAGVVTQGGFPVPSATILSEGTGSSEGVLILDEDEAFYIAKESGDLVSTLEKLIATLEKVAAGMGKTVTALEKTSEGLDKAKSAINTLDTAAFLTAAQAGVPSPPVAASDIAGIGTAKSGLDSAKGELETVKSEVETLKTEVETLKEGLV